MTILPNRSRRFGIGKEIGGAVYLHRDYERLLGDKDWMRATGGTYDLGATGVHRLRVRTESVMGAAE